MMRRTLFLLIPVLLFHLSVLSHAQESLSLSQAIQLGLKNNYDISIIEKNVEMAANLNNQGQAGRWPSIQLRLDQNNSISDQIVTASPFQPQGVVISNALTPAVALNWTLFEGFKVNITKNRYEQLQLESEGNASIVVSNTVQAIVMAYYLLELEKKRFDVFASTMQLSRDRYNYVKLKREFGTAITSDLLLEEGNYLTDSVNHINQELSYRSAVRNLNTLMAIEDLDKIYGLTDTMIVPVESYETADLEKKMLENNADLKTKYLTQSIVKYDLQLARSERYPKVMFSGTAGSTWARVDQSNAQFYNQSTQEYVAGPTEILSSNSNNYGLNFSVTYNLFNGRKINTAIKNAVIREDIGSLELDKMTLSLRKDLYTTLDNFNMRRKIHAINERKLASSKINLDITEDRFKLGSINSFDFRTIQLNYLSAALQELNSRFGLLESKIALMRLSGTILEVYQ